AAPQHLALRLDLGLLRPDQQEIEDDEDQDQREELDEEIAAARAAARLGPCFRYQHLALRSSFFRRRFCPAEKRADYSGPAPLCNATAGAYGRPLSPPRQRWIKPLNPPFPPLPKHSTGSPRLPPPPPISPPPKPMSGMPPATG